MAFYVLVLPAVENRLNRQRDDELMVYMQKLNSANQENDILAQENEDIEAKMAEVQEQLDTLTTGNTSIIAQYQSLIWVLQSYRTGDMVSAAKTFAESSFDLIEDANIQGIVDNIRQEMTRDCSSGMAEIRPRLRSISLQA